MLTSSPSRLIALAALLSSIACGPDSRDVPSAAGVGMNAHAFFPDRSPWSEPVNLGAPVNTDAIDFNPTLSPDERSLYFASNRTGGLGGIDIWVAQRVCVDCPWQAPVNLGPVINSAAQSLRRRAPTILLQQQARGAGRQRHLRITSCRSK